MKFAVARHRSARTHAVAVVDAFSAGSAAELGALFTQEAADLSRYARTLPSVDTSLAEDIVQEAFVAAARDWERLRGLDREARRRWLYTTARNKAVDQWRRSARTVVAAELPDLATEPDPANTMVNSAFLQSVWDEIMRMPPVRSRVLFLRFHEEWTTEEIARLLDVSSATVRSHLKLGRDQLAAALGELPWGDASSAEVGKSLREQ